jgi:hypothetical protein
MRILPSLLLFALAGSLSAQGIQLDESQDLSLRDGMISVNVHNGSGGARASACDDFNRANGGVGAGWTDVSGTQMIVSNQVTNAGALGNAWMRKVGTTEPYATSRVELDLVANPGGSSRYSAAVLGEDGLGGNMLYVKVQNQTGLAGYSNYAFYVGFNGGGRPGYGGFFSFGFQLDAANDGCHMLVETVGDVTQLRLDDDLNGVYEHNFTSGGTVASMGLAFGNNVGYGAWSAGTADNWELNDGCGGCAAPTLSVTGATAGGTATATVDCATASSAVVVAYSLAGGGPVTVTVGCGTVTVNVTPPVTQVNLVSNASGTAAFTTNVPAGTTGVNVWVTGFDVASCTPTNGVSVTL